MFGDLKNKLVMKTANGYFGTEDAMKRLEFRLDAEKKLISVMSTKDHTKILTALEDFFMDTTVY